jgi:hypothetical protein
MGGLMTTAVMTMLGVMRIMAGTITTKLMGMIVAIVSELAIVLDARPRVGGHFVEGMDKVGAQMAFLGMSVQNLLMTFHVVNVFAQDFTVFGGSLSKAYAEKIAPAGVEVEVRLISAGEPCLIPVDNTYVRAATRALKEVWGKETVFIRSGGSIPIVGDFDRHLGMPSVMMGFGLPDDNIHAPNEKFHLKNFELGIESIVRFLEEAGR